MPKFNIQLNHVQKSSDINLRTENRTEEVNPFQVNLRATGKPTRVEPEPESPSITHHSPQQNGFNGTHRKAYTEFTIIVT